MDAAGAAASAGTQPSPADRKSTRLNSSHANISYAVFCLKKKQEPLPATLTPCGQAAVRLLVRQEAGNVPFKGTVNVAVYASATAGAGTSGTPLATGPLQV